MKVVVTGANGFIGRRVVGAAASQGHDVIPIVRTTPREQLIDAVQRSDAVIHLAGVNRSDDPAEFDAINGALTEAIVASLSAARGHVVVLSSSTQSGTASHYGRTKRRAEAAVERFALEGGRTAIFRLPNVFGPGARPNYNSAVATFAFNSANGKPLEVHDAARELSLVWVHDVAAAMVAALGDATAGAVSYLSVEPQYCASVGRLAELFTGFARSRDAQRVPEVGSELTRRLYATYLSYLPDRGLAYDLPTRTDDRGSLAEFLKSDAAGQIFVSRTRPGVTRGNHFHHGKTEKFLVLEGDAIIRFRRVDGTSDTLEYPVSGRDFRVVDIPPDYTHSIENVGATELIVLFWASEIFDPTAPDTHPLHVRQ